jgi:uncharacterized protein YqgC (DUF456 family)
MAASQSSQALSLFTFDTSILSTAEAQHAHKIGLLTAKSEALHSAQRLVGVGRPLLFGVLLVSFVHLWHTVASIKPGEVQDLELWGWIYHVAAALLILSIDATAAYLVSVRGTARYAGDTRPNHVVIFFYVLTGMLNLLFVMRYSPGLPDMVGDFLPFLSFATGLLLAPLIPVSVWAIEHARQTADAARLALLVEVTTLKGIIQASKNKEKEQHEMSVNELEALRAELQAARENAAQLNREKQQIMIELQAEHNRVVAQQQHAPLITTRLPVERGKPSKRDAVIALFERYNHQGIWVDGWSAKRIADEVSTDAEPVTAQRVSEYISKYKKVSG